MRQWGGCTPTGTSVVNWVIFGNMTVQKMTPQEVINMEEQAIWWKFPVDSQARRHWSREKCNCEGCFQ